MNGDKNHNTYLNKRVYYLIVLVTAVDDKLACVSSGLESLLSASCRIKPESRRLRNVGLHCSDVSAYVTVFVEFFVLNCC